MSDELPQGWAIQKLLDVTPLVPTGVPEFYGEVEYYSTGSIQGTKQIPEGYFSFSNRPSRANRWVCVGDVLQARMQGTNKVLLINAKITEKLFSTGFLQLRPDSRICESRYLYRFLSSKQFLDERDSFATGSTQIALTDTGAKQLSIPLPPLPEQRRIVAKLEMLLENVDACQKRLDKIPFILKRFRQSVLAAACSGRLTADWREKNPSASEQAPHSDDADLPEIPESWRWVKLPETGEVTRGRSRHRPRNEPSLFGGPYPFIQTGDIAQSGGRITTHKQTYSEAGLAQSRLWAAGTICITIAANIAESAILTYPACFPDSVVGIIANPKVAVAEYVEFFIRVAKTDLATFAPATAQKNINIGILNEVQVPLPPLPEQHEIVRRVEDLFALADRIEARYQKAKAHVDKLTQSILAKAFRGELVPQDPNDEPATELLNRIKKSKKEIAPAKRK